MRRVSRKGMLAVVLINFSKKKIIDFPFLLLYIMMKSNYNLPELIVKAIQNKKGTDIVILDLEKIEGATCSHYIICTGRSTSQVSSIADNIRDELREQVGIKPYNYDGYRNSEWIVIDYGDIMIHVFLPDVRTHYDLESLWSDADRKEIENID